MSESRVCTPKTGSTTWDSLTKLTPYPATIQGVPNCVQQPTRRVCNILGSALNSTLPLSKQSKPLLFTCIPQAIPEPKMYQQVFWHLAVVFTGYLLTTRWKISGPRVFGQIVDDDACRLSSHLWLDNWRGNIPRRLSSHRWLENLRAARPRFV